MRDRTDSVDHWLRSEGLPLLVPRQRWHHDLLQRTAPLVVLAIGIPAFDAAGRSELTDGTGGSVVAVLAFVVGLLGPGALALWLVGPMTRWPDRTGRLVALAIWPLLPLSLLASSRTWHAWPSALLTSVALLLALHLLVWSGVAALVAWSARWAWRTLPAIQQMASRALPVVLTLVVFAFYSTEPWQVANAMTTAQRWWMVAVLASVAAFAIWPVARREIDDAGTSSTRQEARDLLRGTPLADVRLTDGPVDLGRSRRANATGILILALLIQAGMFLLVIASLLSLLGRLTIADEVVQSWLGHAREPWTFLGSALPIDHQTTRVAVFLGTIGALTFVLTSLSDPSYREQFFDPMLARVKVAVAAHRARLET